VAFLQQLLDGVSAGVARRPGDQDLSRVHRLTPFQIESVRCCVPDSGPILVPRRHPQTMPLP
jgi:hypothetical protein